uniref:Uncharacterized protein n=1 Tax=Sphaerodactylus townsendi TaxID=933632 RepID=A0ACB8ED57_9SAUR
MVQGGNTNEDEETQKARQFLQAAGGRSYHYHPIILTHLLLEQSRLKTQLTLPHINLDANVPSHMLHLCAVVRGGLHTGNTFPGLSLEPLPHFGQGKPPQLALTQGKGQAIKKEGPRTTWCRGETPTKVDMPCALEPLLVCYVCLLSLEAEEKISTNNFTPRKPVSAFVKAALPSLPCPCTKGTLAGSFPRAAAAGPEPPPTPRRTPKYLPPLAVGCRRPAGHTSAKTHQAAALADLATQNQTLQMCHPQQDLLSVVEHTAEFQSSGQDLEWNYVAILDQYLEGLNENILDAVARVDPAMNLASLTHLCLHIVRRLEDTRRNKEGSRRWAWSKLPLVPPQTAPRSTSDQVEPMQVGAVWPPLTPEEWPICAPIVGVQSGLPSPLKNGQPVLLL